MSPWHQIRSTPLTFLGIVVDSARLQVPLPQDKLAHLRARLREFTQTKVVRDYRAVESLTVHLGYAAKVLPLGKAFLNPPFFFLNGPWVRGPLKSSGSTC